MLRASSVCPSPRPMGAVHITMACMRRDPRGPFPMGIVHMLFAIHWRHDAGVLCVGALLRKRCACVPCCDLRALCVPCCVPHAPRPMVATHLTATCVSSAAGGYMCTVTHLPGYGVHMRSPLADVCAPVHHWPGLACMPLTRVDAFMDCGGYHAHQLWVLHERGMVAAYVGCGYSAHDPWAFVGRYQDCCSLLDFFFSSFHFIDI